MHNLPKKRDFLYLAILILLLFIFYPNLFFAKTASLMGDHIEQHYPWTYLLAESIRNFKLPWWTDLIHCGFPIAAEGQIGIFYLPNLILCFLLPVKWAYSYMNILHFFISGYATYLYARQMRLSMLAASIVSFIFLFGSAYGGAYYNLTSLKTIAWFPVSLFFFEKFLEKENLQYLVAISISVALSLLAGYLQIAVFALLIFALYAFFRIFIFPEEKNSSWPYKFKNSFLLCAAVIFSVILTLPQLFLTFELALFSNRVNLVENYAYIGSMSPFALLTFFLIHTQGFLRGNSLYGGVFSIFFVLCTIYSAPSRKTNVFKIWCWVGLVSFLLALGGWSPLYIGLVKLARFYSFRMPAKFLVFICFAVAMLAGIGTQVIQDSIRLKKNQFSIRKVTVTYFALLLLAISCHGFIYYFVTAGRSITVQAGRWFLREFVFGKIGHPHSLEIYYDKLFASLNSIEPILSLGNFWNIWNYCLFALSLVLVFFLWRLKRLGQVWLFAALFFLLIDLYVFAFRDIKRDFDTYQNIERLSPVVEYLKSEQVNGNLGRVYGFREPSECLPVVPSANMLYGFEDIGAYSPLVMKRYYETIGLFGNVNDSNLAFVPTPQFVKGHLGLLNILNVSHILSQSIIEHSAFQLLMYDEKSKTFLYKNQNDHTGAFFVSRVEVFSTWERLKSRLLQPGFNPRDVFLLEKSEYEKIEPYQITSFGRPNVMLTHIQHTPDSKLWRVDVDRPGFFVLANIMYPGWTATLDGKPVPILNAYGLFQSVAIAKAGQYQIQLHYSPFHFGLAGRMKKILGGEEIK